MRLRLTTSGSSFSSCSTPARTVSALLPAFFAAWRALNCTGRKGKKKNYVVGERSEPPRPPWAPTSSPSRRCSPRPPPLPPYPSFAAIPAPAPCALLPPQSAPHRQDILQVAPLPPLLVLGKRDRRGPVDVVQLGHGEGLGTAGGRAGGGGGGRARRSSAAAARPARGSAPAAPSTRRPHLGVGLVEALLLELLLRGRRAAAAAAAAAVGVLRRASARSGRVARPRRRAARRRRRAAAAAAGPPRQRRPGSPQQHGRGVGPMSGAGGAGAIGAGARV
jgi:hypothetical protein